MKTSLAALIRDLLAGRDAGAASRFESTFIAHRPDDAGKPYIEQLRAMNHFWRVQLGLLDVCTIEERECLTDDALLEDYLRNFEECVLPTVVNHNLPMINGKRNESSREANKGSSKDYGGRSLKS